jgi:hypothetical protein
VNVKDFAGKHLRSWPACPFLPEVGQVYTLSPGGGCPASHCGSVRDVVGPVPNHTHTHTHTHTTTTWFVFLRSN